MVLTPQEIRALTGHRRRSLQAQALAFMKIKFRERIDGSLAVLRSDVEGAQQPERRKKSTEPDFSGLMGNNAGP